MQIRFRIQLITFADPDFLFDADPGLKMMQIWIHNTAPVYVGHWEVILPKYIDEYQ
jgi:hypothetical protein